MFTVELLNGTGTVLTTVRHLNQRDALIYRERDLQAYVEAHKAQPVKVKVTPTDDDAAAVQLSPADYFAGPWRFAAGVAPVLHPAEQSVQVTTAAAAEPAAEPAPATPPSDPEA